ncbi:MAG: STAS domain-containing protein [Hahellaceae bacterium]|nr:STAS domain-containing protein [Hahellaceae bacterium]
MSGYKILQAERDGIYVLKFVGEIRLNLCSTLDNIIDMMTCNSAFKTVVIDLTETELVDSTTLGLLAKIAVKAYEHSKFLPTIISTNPDVTKIIGTMGFDKIFIIMKEPATKISELEELPILRESESVVRQKVLDAHKTLMSMSDDNRAAFEDLVNALECENQLEQTVVH